MNFKRLKKLLSRIEPSIWVIAIVALFSLPLLRYSDEIWRDNIRQTVPIRDNVAQAKVYLAKGYLFLEKRIAGDETIRIKDVFQLFDQAIQAINNAVEGRSAITDLPAIPPTNPGLLDRLGQFHLAATQFRDLAQERWQDRELEDAQGSIEQRAAFYELERMAGDIDYLINQSTGQTMARQRQIYALTLALWISTLVGASFFLFRAGRRRRWAEEGLQRAYAELEIRVEERTAELAQANTELLAEKEFRGRIIRSLINGLYVYDLEQGCNDFINPQYTELTGWTLDQVNDMGQEQFTELFHPQDRAGISAHMRAIAQAQDGDILEIEYRFRTKDGRWMWCWSRDTVFERTKTGDVRRFIGSFLDITERKRAQEQIKAALAEKEILLQEIHHRVRNNLQSLIYLIDMQAERSEDPRAIQTFAAFQGRLRAMAMVHDKLHQAKDLAQIDFRDYVADLTAHLRSALGGGRDIALRVDAAKLPLGIDVAMPCGLIVNEMVSNALKHAFPPLSSSPTRVIEGEHEISVRFGLHEGEYVLVVSDNGVGLPPDLDWRATETLGLKLVNLWATHQLGGDIKVDVRDGTSFTIKFPSK